MAEAITETNFSLPGQVGEVYHGKVADTYTINHEAGQLLAVVRTDRISAFDVVLPQPIPYKGQVLNQMSAKLLEASADVAPSWLIDVPDPNVSIGLKAEPIKVEMIMRSHLLGSAWKAYNEEGDRNLCGNILPDNMVEFQPFETPLVTPTSKEQRPGKHDENLTPQEIFEMGLSDPKEYAQMVVLAASLFARGQRMAQEKGLELADTKYEFGRLAVGNMVKIVVIDEAHTPDSSRYFPANEFNSYINGETTVRPEQQSKEFVREWLKAQGFDGSDKDQVPPYMSPELIDEISRKYRNLFESMLGKPFEPQNYDADPLGRIEFNIVESLENIAA